MTDTQSQRPSNPRSLRVGVRRCSWAVLACALAACGGGGGGELQAPAVATAQALAARPALTLSHPALEAHLAQGERRGILAAARVLPSADVLFDWAERTFPQFFPSHRSTQTAAPYRYRYYPETGNYLGLDGETIMVLGPISGHQLQAVGSRADFACQLSPVACGANASRLAVGVGYSLAVRADGSVLQWGELALTTAGTWVPGTTAMRLDGLADIVGVRGGYASAAISAGGVVYSWGDNTFGALGYSPQGLSDRVWAPAPNPVIGSVRDVVLDGGSGELMTIFLRPNGTVGYTPKDRSFGTVAVGTVAGLSGVESLSAGEGADLRTNRGYAVKSDGTVWALKWKEVFVSGGWQYQLAAEQVRGLPAVAQAACTYRYCLVTARDGSVWGWGDGSHGVLGDGTGFTRETPVRALNLGNVERVVTANFAAYAVTRDGALYAWGALAGGAVSQEYYRTHTDDFLRPQVLIESRFGVAEVATSGSHALMLLKDGTLWGWGANSEGQLGDGTKDSYDGRIVRVLGVNLN